MGKFIQHEPCDECGSSDALGRYDDGSAHCFSCGHNIKADGQESDRPARPDRPSNFIRVSYELSLIHI